MAATSASPNLFTHARSLGVETIEVQQNDVQIAFWPPESTVRYLVTGALNTCTAIAIISPRAGILAHIAPLPNGTTGIQPGTDPGPVHVRGLLTTLTTLFMDNQDKFDPSETWVIAGIWNNRPAMEDGIRLTNAVLTRLRLTPSPMDDLPCFLPIGTSPSLTDDEMEVMFRSANPKVAALEAKCKAGDLSYVLGKVDQILQEGTVAQDLQICLQSAANARHMPLVEKLLSLGVPVNTSTAVPAIQQGSLELLSLYLGYGWDINKEMEWCIPPPLS
ncbi:hypothetical protein B0A55_10978 [Friedmanniomyces simplex]|uniref:Uncharacterized protein n=1 Tax=Friedmanniomyces simplex TaxID=329884 RepID=A0A4U0WTZ9_9PEZI|nr:hypothetical protein B0A55_10978 [Friedmanniomyces simplex]